MYLLSLLMLFNKYLQNKSINLFIKKKFHVSV